jgi:ribonuclease E
VESRKNRRRDGRENNRRRVNISESEFLARRESVDRVMVVRDREGITQIGVLEDGILVEHYVTQAGSTSFIGNVYLGRVQNVLPSMEAVFIDIGRGRNGVLYAGEINWDLLGITKTEDRRVENVLKAGDPILVQVSKDPVGQKGARLTHMASLPGRYVVYVPNSTTTGISRKLADNERNRLKSILRGVLPDDGGVIVRTAAEGASEEELSRDVHRLLAQWEDIKAKSTTAKAPALLYSEPDMTIKVVRDIFNEDFKVLRVAGDDSHDTVRQYIEWVAPDLLPRLEKWIEPQDIFSAHRVDEQLAKALDRKVHLPSGGSLVIDRTEAMTVVDVNTGRFIGSGGNLEETVTKNNLEAAEEIVRQLRLRDIGGIIVVDFIDMVLETNRDLVLRRLVECLGRDRTKHQVAEVTSLGLVQMTRKRIGQGLLEVFSAPCDHCNGRGVRITAVPVPVKEDRADADRRPRAGSGSEGRSDSRSESKPEGRGDDSGEGRSGDRTKHQVKSGSARNQGRSGRGKQVGATSSASPSSSPSTDSNDAGASVAASGGSTGESTSAGDSAIELAATAVSLSAE